jgi:hypothetical protein
MRYALMVAVMAALAVPTVAAARPKPPAGCTVNDKGKPEFTCVTRFPQTIVWVTQSEPTPTGVWVFAHCGEPVPA